jgi:photosystem II stability/assembly factor-like uncharacterized protein
MKKRLMIAGACAALAVAAFSVFHASQPPGALTADEVALQIAEKKAAMKAQMAAEGHAYEPGAFPNDWALLQRTYPKDRLDFEALREAALDAQAMRLAAERSSPGVWVERGPSNIGARLTDLAIHPINPSIVYAAMASGGVFRSVDGGTTWDPIFDDQAVLTIGAIALDPSDPDIIYVGTGEANSASFSWFGTGVYKSTDGGASWAHLGLEETRYIGRIVVDPLNTDRIWVAAAGVLFGTSPERGVYRSLDAGDSWDQVFALTDSTSCIDLAVNPDNPDIVYAAMWERVRRRTYRRSGGPSSGIWRSQDGGDSWAELTTGLPTGSDVGRIGVSVAASDPDILYAMYSDDPGYFMGVYKSVNGGNSWTATNDGALDGLTSSFGWYFGQIRVDPTNPDRVFTMGVPFYRTQNGGDSWSEVGDDNHVDHHAMAFDPLTPSRIFEGNDGGIYVSNTSGNSWMKLYDQPTNQFYAIEIDYQHPERLYGGTQDNGTLRTVTGGVDDWERIFGGDGFYTVVDYTDPNIIFAEYQYGNLYKSEDFADSWDYALNGVDEDDRRNWSTPVVMDRSDQEVLYYGTYRLYRTTNGAGSWSPISPDLTNGNHGGNYGTITTIAVSPSLPNVLYVGTDDSNVWVTQSAGLFWSNVSSTLPDRWVSRVAVDSSDPAVAYATFSGLRWDEDISHVYRTDNYGVTWTSIGDGLPDAPVNAIVVDPDIPSVLYVGSDVGCFYTKNLGQTWEMLGSGLPAVPIYDLKIHQPTRTLVAGTHGRSMHSIDLNATSGVASPEVEPVVTAFRSHPNPFRAETAISYTLREPSQVSLTVYDIAGRKVRDLESGGKTSGEHSVRWDGRSDEGRVVASGTYFLLLEAGQTVTTRKVSLLR